MGENFVRDVIDNFRKQHKLYSEMRDLAYKQKACLSDRKNMDIEGFLRLLKERNIIMDEISRLSQENVKLRGTAVSLLGIDNFTLSELKGRIEENSWEELRWAISELNRVLLEISEVDHENSVILKDWSGVRYRNSQGGYKEAENLYRKVMQEKRPN